jgi:hypothetical protein
MAEPILDELACAFGAMRPDRAEALLDAAPPHLAWPELSARPNRIAWPAGIYAKRSAIFLRVCADGRLRLAQWMKVAFDLTSADVCAGHDTAWAAACGAGHLAVAQWLAQTFETGGIRAWGYEALIQACAGGHCAIVEWLMNFGVECCDIPEIRANGFVAACNSGSLRTAQHFADDFDVKPVDARGWHNQALERACIRGDLEMAAWLVDRFSLTAQDARVWDGHIFRSVCEAGHFTMAQWLTGRFLITRAEARAQGNYTLRLACGRGHLRVVQWLVGQFRLTAADVRAGHDCALRRACAHGHAPTVQWLIETFGYALDDLCDTPDCARRSAMHAPWGGPEHWWALGTHGGCALRDVAPALARWLSSVPTELAPPAPPAPAAPAMETGTPARGAPVKLGDCIIGRVRRVARTPRRSVVAHCGGASHRGVTSGRVSGASAHRGADSPPRATGKRAGRGDINSIMPDGSSSASPPPASEPGRGVALPDITAEFERLAGEFSKLSTEFRPECVGIEIIERIEMSDGRARTGPPRAAPRTQSEPRTIPKRPFRKPSPVCIPTTSDDDVDVAVKISPGSGADLPPAKGRRSVATRALPSEVEPAKLATEPPAE